MLFWLSYVPRVFVLNTDVSITLLFAEVEGNWKLDKWIEPAHIEFNLLDIKSVWAHCLITSLHEVFNMSK
jgi:hypothetical protein